MKGFAYPLRHVPIRVPWHDSGWNGTVCNQPAQRTARLRLANIAERKVEDDDAGITYLWEHSGMLHDPAYRGRWEERQHWHRQHGILPLEKGGRPKGTLIVTRDQQDGGIDSTSISALVARIGGR